MEDLITKLEPWLHERPISLVILIMTAAAFLVYGLQIFVSRYMSDEYKRYGMTVLQKNLVGCIQIGGSLGLITGLIYPILGLITAFGFVIMMSVALFVRWRLQDTLPEFLPAFILLCINAWLCVNFYLWINH
ncbi:MAG: DoxX family protein [Saprospiraceae bacterium]|nr:DoxX family protein [Saprospiraceae bacterium]